MLGFLATFNLRTLAGALAAYGGVRFAPLVSLRYACARALRALGGSSSQRVEKGTTQKLG